MVEAMCTGCDARTTTAEALDRLDAGEDDPCCVDCGAILKTATVMFGENLDPAVLLGPRERVLRRADEVLARAGGRPGHVFNLGHGVLPGTPVGVLQPSTLAESWTPALCLVVADTCVQSISLQLGSAALGDLALQAWVAGEPGADFTRIYPFVAGPS